MSQCRAVCIDPKKIEEILPAVSDLLDRAIAASRNVSRERAISELRAGTFQLWLAASDKIEALAVTQVDDGVCVVVLCAGDEVHRWAHLIEQIESFARAEGCGAVRIYGRAGWERVLAGYRKTRVILERKLS